MSTAQITTDEGAAFFSASQMMKFADCEQKWLFSRNNEGTRFASGEPAALGTLLHTLQGAWWSGRSWRLEWLKALSLETGAALEDLGYTVTMHDTLEEQPGWGAPREFLRAIPIMEAWERVHSAHPSTDPAPEAIDALDFRERTAGLAGAELVALELPFDLPVPGVKGARVRGFIDGLVSVPSTSGVRTSDTYKALEFKSMGRWGKDGRVAWDPQVNLYLWAAKQLFNIDGLVFEAISTYAYKGEPKDTDPKRFRRIEVAYDERAVARTLDDMRRLVRRATAVRKSPGLAVRNPGEACTYCEFFKECRTPWDL